MDREVTLCGWVDTYRDHGGGVFIDVRDRYGLTQVVVGPPESGAERSLFPTPRVIHFFTSRADQVGGETLLQTRTVARGCLKTGE